MSELLQLFKEFQGRKIAIYGLSTETEKVLPELTKNFEIIGLLDGYKEDGEIYGLSIIPFSEVLNRKAELIIVVARPGSCKAIAKRIGKMCLEYRITLLDIRGKNLLETQKIVYDFKGVEGTLKQELWNEINQHEIITFDLFDTLIMRNTLFPTDVYEIVDGRLKEQGIEIEGFAGKRLESEKYLAKQGSLPLIEIYKYMIEKYHISGISAEKLANMEWEADNDLLLPRIEMCEIVTQLYRQGKEVYIISDTYYTKEQLQYLMKAFGNNVTDIFASCEYGVGKTQGLYDCLKERIGEKSCVHIGDDSIADIECAKKFGLDTLKIYSGMELLESVGYMGMWEYVESLADRIKIGMFVAKIFNSPFQFEETRTIEIAKAYDIGYLFAAPVITDFMIWFEKKVHEYKFQNVWMGARDGYLLKKLYDYLKGKEMSTYFFTSRTATIRAGIENEEDIRYVTSMKFSGSLKEQLYVRLGIESDATDEYDLMDYKDIILNRSKLLQKNYKQYICNLDIKDSDIAFFDFVAKGTTQVFLRRFVEKKIKGLYFLQLEEDYMRKYGLDIDAFYTQTERNSSTIFEDYYILETILTSPDPSINEFDFNGKPVYADETRSERDLECVLNEQEGIFEYFVTFIKLCPKMLLVPNKKLDEILLGLIHKLDVIEKGFLDMRVEDPFFNRNTEITDLL